MKKKYQIAFGQMKLQKYNFRIWAAYALGFGLCLKNMHAYISLANGIDYSIQIMEPYILIGTRIPYFMGTLLGGLLLVSDAPFITQLSNYEIIRVGRKKWVITQMLYIVFRCIRYSVAILFFSCFMSFISTDVIWSNNWSETMNMVAVEQSYFVIRKFAFSFEFPEYIMEVKPYLAMLLTLFYNSLYMILAGFCIFVINLIFKHGAGWLVAAILHIVGYVIYANGGAVLSIKYSLLCCAAPGYHYIEKYSMSPIYSATILVVISLIIFVLAICASKKVNCFGEY